MIKLVTPVYYGESRRVTQIPGDEFIVRLRNIKDRELLDILNSRYGANIIGNVGDDKGYLLKTSNGNKKNSLELSDIYFHTGIFDYAEPNFIYPENCLLNYTPNDPYFPKQWALNNTGQTIQKTDSAYGDLGTVTVLPGADIDANLAWNYTKGNSQIKIGFTDTGIDSTHPDFRNGSLTNLLPGYDAYYNKYGVPKDSGFAGGHGTCTAGIIGAQMNNAIGVAGIAPDCKLMAFRIFAIGGVSNIVEIARAFDTARVKGIDVLSNGWNGQTANSTMTNAITNLALNGRGGLGCIVLFSAGNEGRKSVWYPSYLPEVISVGATTMHDQKKAPGTGNQFDWGCNYGEDANGDLDILTPTICYTTDIQGAYGYSHSTGTEGSYYSSFGGTSCTCPTAASVAALILSVNPSLSRTGVMDKLFRGCDKVDNIEYCINKSYGKWSEYCAYGRVNAYNSVRLAAGADVTPPTINHKNIASHSSTYPTKLIAEIVDQNGSPVPSNGNQQPKVFYRINKNNSVWSGFDSLTCSTLTGNNFTFQIPSQGFETQVQYYIRAYDNAGNVTTFPRGAPSNFWLCYFTIANVTTVTNSIGTFTLNDPGVTYSPSIAFGNFIILDTRARIYLRHSRISDEIIQLVSPIADANKNRKCLFASNGGTAANITGASVSDSAQQYWFSGTPPYINNTFKADYTLNGYNGTSASGNWKILNYDQYSGIQGTCDSIILTFTKASGITSPCIRLNTPGDSILNFGTVNFPDSSTKNYYVKNCGTSGLNISQVNFTGSNSSIFSIINFPSQTIAAGDSGLFVVRIKTALLVENNIRISQQSTDASLNAVMHIINNDPSKSDFEVSLLTDNSLPPVKSLHLKVYEEGLYFTGGKIIRDTMRIFLRENVAPFSLVDSSKCYLDSKGEGIFNFLRASDNTDYYIQLKHRNSMETWSNSGQRFIEGSLYYDFTNSVRAAYGNNLKLVDSTYHRYGIYAGDINQSGGIDLSDLIDIYNDAFFFRTGYLNTDVNGDSIVDLVDIILTFNNSFYFVTVQRP